MKSYRIVSFVFIALALAVLLGQSFGGALAAPSGKLTASVSATLQGSSVSAGTVSNPIQPSDVQYFQDVAVGSFWYNYTASLYQEGITTGYPCNHPPAGPCGNPPLPYYLPNENIIRGQVAAFFSRSLAPGVYITGPYTGTTGRRGAFNATNTNLNDNNNAGLYGKGPHGVTGIADSNGSQNSVGGYFDNPITYTNNSNWGVYASVANGVGVYGVSAGSTSSQDSAGIHGVSTGGGEGGEFGGYAGIVANAGSASVTSAGDGLDIGAPGGTRDAIYSIQPSGDANWTLFGNAHIHGSNITGADYEVEVRYDGSEPAQIGDVLAADGNNSMDGGTAVLGVTKADSSNANAAIGVFSYRLTYVKVGGQDKPLLDTSASVQPGEYAYVTVVGQARMKLAGTPSIGDRVSLNNGNISVASKDADSLSIGKVVSKPDKDGYVTVFVNLK
ncbi:MAG: hypothetical protein DLM69_05730 [Candidatus Chloroheliales bacterium]|nr:MAG: hypothetical protein DLM69_05730 [Chloroflexota bacterium]